MFKFCFLSSLLLVLTKGQCTPEDFNTPNHLIVPWTNDNRYIKVDFVNGRVGASLGSYSRRQHDKFSYTTRLMDCPNDNQDYVFIRSQNRINGRQYYLANNLGTNLVDLVEDTGAPFLNGQDERLFKYTGGDGKDLASFECKREFISTANAEVRYSARSRQWSLWPFITRTSNFDSQFTRFLTTFVTNRRATNVALYLSSTRTFGLISDNSDQYFRLGRRDLEFEIIQWRMYIGFDRNGDIRIGQAVALRRPFSERYISIPSHDGRVMLFNSHCQSSRSFRRRICVSYSPARFQHYADSRQSRRIPHNRRDVRFRNAVDERFFEVVPQRDGTTRLRSALDPRKYLAIRRMNNNRYQLVIAELNTRSDAFSYDLRIKVPTASSDVMEVPRLPCTGNTLMRRRHQRHLFTCA